MRRTPLSDGWTVGPKRGLFDALSGEVAAAVPVSIPHDAMREGERSADVPGGSSGGYFPGGAVEYLTTLEIPAGSEDRVRVLMFDGVMRDAMVFVDDNFAAQRPSGYARFLVDLAPFITGAGALELRVEARAHRDSRWYSGLGIHRSVALWEGPTVHIAPDGMTVTTPEVGDAGSTVVVETRVVNAGRRTATVPVTTRILGAEGRALAESRSPITLLAGESGVVRERFWIAEIPLWNPDAPVLHRATATVEGATVDDAGGDASARDDAEVVFGIRSLQLDPQHGLRINGRTVKLRGACIHHDNGVLGARTFARAEERRIALLKSAGFNAIRSAHNPASPELLDACDRLGMLVMDEAFDMWLEPKSPFDGSLTFADWWERDLEALVAKDRNHPSVVFYSIGNEIPETGRPHGSRLGRLLAEKVHHLDPTRFTTNGINGLVSVIRELPPLDPDAASASVNDAMTDAGSMMVDIVSSDLVTAATAESFAVLDAAGMNYGDGRYVPDAARFPTRVIIGTETFPTRIDVTWPLVEENDHVVGDFTWTGWDYLGEAGIGRVDYVGDGGAFGGTSGPYPWQLAWCGDFDITGFRRPVSYYREIVFGRRAAPYLAVRRPRTDGLHAVGGPWSWTDSLASWSWDVPAGTPVVVEVYSDADEVELLQDGVSVGVAAVGREHRFRAAFEVAYAPGELVAVARRAGVEVGRDRLRTWDADPQLAVTAERTELKDEEGELGFVTIALVDDQGDPLPDRDARAEIEVAGPGVLLGFGSARPDTTESYGATSQLTFDGRAQAVIRPTRPGRIVVSVRVDGIGAADIELVVT